MGPTGKLLKPYGDLEFEDAYEAYKEVVIAGKEAGADLVIIETMGDGYELKAAVLAAKKTAIPRSLRRSPLMKKEKPTGEMWSP